ncbi:MAG: hypothetical protein CO108_08510 [Deltaproteobacteria bacterium CG_4_9_14_3_um_filter_63_12]|nr:MAG: hypothetical protein CO108_08510 [Deltaproteobacteria bacterium CG_4_9_14_3_um_filter_63_12]
MTEQEITDTPELETAPPAPSSEPAVAEARLAMSAEQEPEPRRQRGSWKRRALGKSKAESPGNDRLLRFGLLALVLFAPLTMGGVHFLPALLLPLLALALATYALHCHWEKGLHLGLVGVLLGAWVLVTALQLVPLPFGLVQTLSPNAAASYQQTYGLLGESPGWVPLSVSPSRTAIALWTVLGLFAVYVTAFLHFRTRHRFAWVLEGLLAVALLFGFASLLQTGLYKTSILGFFPIDHLAATRLKTPLLNSNHAAAFFGAMSPIALGLALASNNTWRRATFIVFYILLSGFMFMCESRGAMLAWLLSHLVFWFVSRDKANQSRLVSIVVVLGMLLAIAAAAYVGHRELDVRVQDFANGVEGVTNELERDTDGTEAIDILEANIAQAKSTVRLEKVAVYRDLPRILSDYPLVGIGRGAFGDLYPAYSTQGLPGTFRHVENEPLELLVEYGVFFGLLFLIIMGLTLVRWLTQSDWREAERPLAAGLLTALTFLTVQNLFDFNLRYIGLGFLFALCAGVVAGRRTRYLQVRREHRTRKMARGDEESQIPKTLLEQFSFPTMVVTLAVVGLSTFVALGNISNAKRGANDDDVVALRLVVDKMEPTFNPEQARKEFLATARAVLISRPVDGHLTFLVGLGLLRTGHGGAEVAEPWLETARTLTPADYRVHLLLGRVLATQGRFDAAAKSFAAAAALHRGVSRDVLKSAAEVLPTVKNLELSLTEDPAEWTLLGAELIRGRRFAEALELGDFLDREHPDHPEGIDLQIRTLVALGIPEGAADLIDDMVERFGDLPATFKRKAELALTRKDYRAADAALEEGLEHHPGDTQLLLARVDLLLGPGRHLFDDDITWRHNVEVTFVGLRSTPLSNTAVRFQYQFTRGRFLAMVEEYRAALTAFESAHQLARNNLAAMRMIVDMDLKLGELDRAETMIQKLSKVVSKDETAELLRRLDAEVKAAPSKRLSNPMNTGLGDGRDLEK